MHDFHSWTVTCRMRNFGGVAALLSYGRRSESSGLIATSPRRGRLRDPFRIVGAGSSAIRLRTVLLNILFGVSDLVFQILRDGSALVFHRGSGVGGCICH